MKRSHLAVGLGVVLLGALLMACQGPEGPAGAAGERGPVGERGPTGTSGVAGIQGTQGIAGPQGPQGIAGAIGPQGLAGPTVAPAGTGIKAEILGVTIAPDRKVTVRFKATDGAGVPLRLWDLDPALGGIATLARIEVEEGTGLTKWVSYNLDTAVRGQPYVYKGETRQPAVASGVRPSFVERLTATNVREEKPGEFSYTLTTVLPEGYAANATHRLGLTLARVARVSMVNATLDFVPAGGAVTQTRVVVAPANCYQCHDPAAASPFGVHAGLMRSPDMCVTCHTSQHFDPETGNTLEFKVLVHKIHRSEGLPSVRAGKPYFIVGPGQTVLDFSNIAFPAGRDIRTCTTCHGAPAGVKAEDYAKMAPNATNYKNAPNTAACTACHDDVDLTTGKGHGPDQRIAGDRACKTCHAAEGQEFDESIVGAHTVPGQSKQLKGYKVEIVRVSNTAPGQKPTVVFTAKDNAGNVVPVSGIGTLAFNVKGPTTDYTGPKTTESADLGKIVTDAGGNYAYTLTRAIPADAKGTWAVGIESRRTETIIGKGGQPLNVNVYTYNPVAYVPVTDAVAVPRRQAVATEKCNVCHLEIAFHGGGRKNTAEYCELCHNPANVDVPNEVPATLGGPFAVAPQSINFRLMIHRVHSGEELTRDFTIYRTRGVFNFNEIRFPGDRQNCQKCHVAGAYTLPLPATMANTLAPREFYSPLGPAASACLGCHDNQATASHAFTMTTPFGEACAVCHGEGMDFAVTKVHKQ